jgi:lipopolysaccharide export LptBFGC system permease protein LptF
MTRKYINPKASGLVAALFIFLLVHIILGKNEDGNLVVFGVPAIVGGLIVYYIVRFMNRVTSKNK